jgi:hypothetical protein
LQLVHERARNTLETVRIGKDFLSPAIKKKDGQMGLHEIKKLLLHRVRENIASYISDKGLITRIYRELKNLNSPKINEPIKTWATELNRIFSKEEIQNT